MDVPNRGLFGSNIATWARASGDASISIGAQHAEIVAELILVLSFHHLELFLHTSHIIAKQNGWLRTSATSHIPREAASRVYALCSTRA